MSSPAAKEPEEDWRLLAASAAGCLVFGAAGVVAEVTLGLGWVALAGYALAYLSGGWDAAVDSVQHLRRGRLDIHFLMLAVAAGAAATGNWHDGALLLLLFSASGAMEAFAEHRTRREIDALLQGAPKSARVLVDGVERVVPVDELRPGMTVLVTDGEQAPTDLEITRGETACDESPLTGESVPVPKRPGDEVLGGTLNVAGAFEGRVLRPAGDSALHRIIRLIAEAQEMKAPSQRFSDRFGTGYTWFALATCAAMFFVWWLGFGLPAFAAEDAPSSAFYRAMTLLVVLSPCALVLSVPSAILSAIARGARLGILFRGGVAVETLAAVDVVALDKTGTLTTGDLRLVGERTLRGELRDLHVLAANLARLSTHPLSRAIRREAAAWEAPVLAGGDVQAFPGKGLRASFDGRLAVLGSRRLVEQEFGPLGDAHAGASPGDAGLAEVWVSDGRTTGVLMFADEMRESAPGLLARLAAEGVRTVMLTGDRRTTAATVARRAGLEEFRAELLPQEKLAAIQELKEGGRRKVAMIGDGVNDAPCLAAADVGVAMGARGSDAALEQADVVLMNDRLESFLLARHMSRRARTVIRQNIAVSLGTVAVMAAVVFLFPVPLGLGVVAHEGSTVIVVLNALRLLAIQRERAVPASGRR